VKREKSFEFRLFNSYIRSIRFIVKVPIGTAMQGFRQNFFREVIHPAAASLPAGSQSWLSNAGGFFDVERKVEDWNALAVAIDTQMDSEKGVVFFGSYNVTNHFFYSCCHGLNMRSVDAPNQLVVTMEVDPESAFIELIQLDVGSTLSFKEG